MTVFVWRAAALQEYELAPGDRRLAADRMPDSRLRAWLLTAGRVYLVRGTAGGAAKAAVVLGRPVGRYEGPSASVEQLLGVVPAPEAAP